MSAATSANEPTFPEVNAHTLQRWDERTDTDEHIVTAWYLAIDLTDRLPMFDDGRGDLVRVRYYPPEDVLMIRRNTTLKTVTQLDKSESDFFIRKVREYAHVAINREEADHV